jgi:hypothetical protein
MDNVQSNEDNLSKIELVEACGEWFVRVIENGQASTMSFELETIAVTYAEGQRLRLGLDRIDRI